MKLLSFTLNCAVVLNVLPALTHNANFQVTLPPKDDILAPGMFGEGESGPRHFDFSAAPDVPGFDYASECEAQYEMGDESAYRAFLARSE